MKLRKGISILVLVITITVMLILVSGIVFTYSNIQEDTLKMEFAKEIYSVQKLVDSYYFKNNKYPILDKVDLNVSTMDSELKEQFGEEVIDSNSISLYEIDLKLADIDDLKRGNGSSLKDKYVVSIKTGKVYYYKGEVLNGKVYYTLTDDLKSLIGL